MSDLAIRFKLRDLRDIEPWGEPNAKSLSWFGITDGCYCIETAAGKLLGYDGPVDPGLGESWCDYQVVRLFEDILQSLPYIFEPIPPDIIGYFFSQGTPCASAASVTEADLWRICKTWFDCRMRDVSDYSEVGLFYDVNYEIWRSRAVDFGYLRVKPQLHLWRVGSTVHLDWEAKSPWLPPKARLTLAVEEVRDAVAKFCEAFLAEMRERVALIVREGWPGEQCDINVPRLASEQIEREKDAATALAATRVTDWEQIRRWLAELDRVEQKP